MKNIKIFIIPIFLILSGCDNGTAQDKNKIDKSRVQSENKVLAPDFTLADLEGKNLSLSDLRGKVILLNFWGTWCGPCKREIPDFINLIDKHKENGLEIVGVTLSSGSAKKIQEFAKKWGINYILLTDIQGNETQSVTARYGQATGRPITGIPTTFIIDREGYIRQSYVGPRSEEIFYKDLEPYL